MARQEAEREDLMAEATALRERIEYAIEGLAEPIIAGFRQSGQWSLYFGSDPVYHFAADGALRRAFCAGDLYRTQGTTLARLRRARAANEVQLVRHDLTPAELAQFISRMHEHLAMLKQALETGSAQITRQVPEDAHLEARLLGALGNAIRFAAGWSG
jgi:siderophore synthetase component